MIRIPGRIPVIIHFTFWLFAALIGFMISESLFGTLLWTGIIFVSVLFHEFGHALTALFFGQNPRIELVALGGLTYHEGQNLPLWKQFFIVLNGPLFGFLLFASCAFLLTQPGFNEGLSAAILTWTRNVNLFWTVVNLLPVMPLDGGQLLRIVLEGFFGVKGFRYSLLIGLVLSILISLGFFLMQNFLIGALFFLFAFQSFDLLRKTRHLSGADRDRSLREALEAVEESLIQGKKQEAMAQCEKIRAQVKEGMIFETATQYLAFLKYEEGLDEETYKLLASIREVLQGDALCLLHKVAFDKQDFSLVKELSASCFQVLPTAEIALKNACAHAQLKEAMASVGWLQTAIDEGLADVAQITSDSFFDPIRQDSSFKALLAKLRTSKSQ